MHRPANELAGRFGYSFWQARRVREHREKLVEGFTSKYNIHILVYYESTSNVHAALAREKQIKGWVRAKKIALIDSMNPEWKDLSQEWSESSQ